MLLSKDNKVVLKKSLSYLVVSFFRRYLVTVIIWQTNLGPTAHPLLSILAT